MTAAAPRTANGTPDLRRIGVAVGAITLAVALLVAFAFVRQAGTSSVTSTGQSKNLVVTGTHGGGINYTGIPYPAPGNDIVVKGTNGGGINYTGIPYPVAQPAPKTLPGLHGSPSGLSRRDMSAAAYAAIFGTTTDQLATAAAIAARDATRHSGSDMSSAAYLALKPAVSATPADINAAIYAAQQDAAAKLSAAAWAAQHPAPFVSSAPSGDMTMAAWAMSHPAIPATPADISAAIYAAQAQAAAEMSTAAWAALHPGTAAINATGGDMSSAAYAARQQAATTATHADMSSPSFLNHRAR